MLDDDDDDNDNVDPPAFSPLACLQVPWIEVVPNRNKESDSWSWHDKCRYVLSNIANTSNISKEYPIDFNHIGVYVTVYNCVGTYVYTWCRKVWD